MDVGAAAGRVEPFEHGDAIAARTEAHGGGQPAEPAADDQRVGRGPSACRARGHGGVCQIEHGADRNTQFTLPASKALPYRQELRSASN